MSDHGAIVFVVASDDVFRLPDVLGGAAVWRSRGFEVEVLGLESGRYPAPRWTESGIHFHPTRAWGAWCWQRLRTLGARCRAGERRRDRPPEPTDRRRHPREGPQRAALRTKVGRWVTLLDRAGLVAAQFLRLSWRPPRLVIAGDIPSGVVARLVRAVRGTPYVYQPRELTCGWDARTSTQRLAKRLERLAHRSAAVTFTYDELRGDLLVRDNGVDPATIRHVPNAPIGVCAEEWRHRWRWPFALPPDAKIVLYAGSVIREHMVAEIVDSVPGWPAEAVLIVHGPIARDYRPTVEAAASRSPGRVFFSEKLVPEHELDRLYAGADVGVAFYAPVSDNFRYVGKAAGKIFHWMKMGVPVVVNDLPGMRDWIEGDGVGAVVSSPCELGDAVRRLAAAGPALRDHCRATFARYEFGGLYGRLVDRTIRELGLLEG